MSIEKKFINVILKTYPNTEDISTVNIPLIKLNNKIVGNKIVGLPFLDTIRIENTPKAEEIKNLTDNNTGEKIEIRLSQIDDNEKLKEIVEKKGFIKQVLKGHIITRITNEEDMWKRFHKHTRNDIRKAEKSGIRIVEINNNNEIKAFYKAYVRIMRAFGTPPHSYNFFLNILKEEDFAYGINCYKDNKMIASNILLFDQKRSYLAFNISNNKYRDYRPNDMLYWETIKFIIHKKIPYFDAGQVDLITQKATREYSLRKFKTKWLGEVYNKEIYTLNMGTQQGKKDKLKKLRIIWKKMPILLTKIIGPRITRELGN
jgi:lipid II:glycine glycyltransferase (peptidoglycan interpeptide bridge formation enzyme)